MKKLSQAQEKAYNKIVSELKEEKERYKKPEDIFYFYPCRSRNKKWEDLTPEEQQKEINQFENLKNNITYVNEVNTRTLQALEKAGLIKIIDVSNGWIDLVQVL